MRHSSVSLTVPLLLMTAAIASPFREQSGGEQPTGVSLVPNPQPAGNREKIILIREFTDCPNENPSGIILWKQLDMIGGGRTAINARIEFTTVVKKITKINLAIYKCPSFAENNKCEFFMKIPIVTNFCDKLREENHVWTPVVNSIHPPLRCPFQKGVYEVKNLTYDPRMYESLMMGIDKNYWRVHVRFMDGKSLAFCSIVGGEIVKIRAGET
ncbi:hypothetical protein AAG570_012348 [Ranatra chinensis]|uniref:MD-2-related lipid-recognition domain-containing protein n=1 Tax=Ranatra chinensis TaxID=642074 RepID=A0ABD0YII9_9HEMI